MKKFSLKLLAYLFGVTVLLFLTIALLIKIRPEYFLGVERIDHMRCNYKYSMIKSKTNFKNIIMGDSKGAVNINPLILGKNWGNLSIEGSNFFEAYISLKYFLKLNKVDTLLMCYGVQNNFEGISSHINIKTIPFEFNSFEELLDLEKIENKEGYMISDAYNFSTTCFGKKIISDKDYLLYKQYLRRLRYIHFPLSYRETFIDGLFNSLLGFHNKRQNDLTIEYMKSHLGQYQLSLTPNYSYPNMILDLENRFKPNLVNFSYLDSIVQITNKNKIFTCIILGPINKGTNNKFLGSVYQQSLSSFINKTKSQYPSLIFLDSNPICIPDSCFGDQGGHTNPRGTTFFSNVTKSKLKLIQIENKLSH